MKLKKLVTAMFLVFSISTALAFAQKTNKPTGRANSNSSQTNAGRMKDVGTDKARNSNQSADSPAASADEQVPGSLPSSAASGQRSNMGTDNDLRQLQDKVAAIENDYISQNDLGLFSWVPNEIILALVGLLILIALALHLLHLFRMSSFDRHLQQLAIGQRNLATRSGGPPVNQSLELMSDQLKRQAQGIAQALNGIKEMENRFIAYNGRFRDAVQALTLTANWIGQAQLRDAFKSTNGDLNERERDATIAMLESYEEPLRVNASRLEPLDHAVAELVNRVESRPQASPELTSRLKNLAEGIGLFGRSHHAVTTELQSLKRGSFSERCSRLQSDQEQLAAQVNSGALSVAEMVQRSRSLMDRYFPEAPPSRSEPALPLAERESNLKKTISDTHDYLMDWYNNLFQLHSQLAQVQRAGLETEIAMELPRVQQIARETLGRFDIQPEAIQVGQTSYDRRLHDAALVKQAAQYPTNTVIEVHRCGFRRMSTGEVLRRPQVVVAGAATA